MVELPGGGTLTHAAIIGHDGGVWAKSDEFPDITPGEVQNIVQGFDDDSKLSEVGLVIGGQKYFLIQGEKGAVIRGRQGKFGVVIKKTHTAMVVGIYGEQVQAGDCSVLVEGLGDYLMEMNI